MPQWVDGEWERYFMNSQMNKEGLDQLQLKDRWEKKIEKEMDRKVREYVEVRVRLQHSMEVDTQVCVQLWRLVREELSGTLWIHFSWNGRKYSLYD